MAQDRMPAVRQDVALRVTGGGLPAVMSDFYAASQFWEDLPQDGTTIAGQDFTVCETPAEYRPRNPAESILCRVLAAELGNFLERQRLRDRHVPRFVERELQSFVDCGIMARGFLRIHCDACRLDRLVPFSCYPQWETMKTSTARAC